MDGVNVAFGSRGMTVEGGCAKDRKEWRSLVHIYH